MRRSLSPYQVNVTGKGSREGEGRPGLYQERAIILEGTHSPPYHLHNMDYHILVAPYEVHCRRRTDSAPGRKKSQGGRLCCIEDQGACICRSSMTDPNPRGASGVDGGQKWTFPRLVVV